MSVPAAPPATVGLRAALEDGERAAVLDLLAAAEHVDGVPPVSDQGLLEIRAGSSGSQHLLARADGAVVGYGHLTGATQDGPADGTADGTADGPGDQTEGGTPSDAEPVVGELVVHPDHRRAGTGRALVRAALAARGPRALQLWMHGDLPGARAIAEHEGLERTRELWTMSADLGGGPGGPVDGTDLPEPVVPDDVLVRTFRSGQDEDAWLAVNARAFAHHPEQGSWTRADLLAREDEPWFDPEGFFLAVDAADGRLLGSHWTKVHPATADAAAVGEVYVVGIDPQAQGRRLGGLLTLVGLRHLRERGLQRVVLYVEADNAAALSVYRRLGFARSGADVVVTTPEHATI